MIAYLDGIVHDARASDVVILTQGIGFLVQVPGRYMLQKGAHISLDIYTHITQDQGMQLYGFQTYDERIVFGLIISCSGFGPRIGLAILNGMTPSLIVSALMTSDIKTLSSIDGLGPKKAENLISQLKDKASRLQLSQSISLGASSLKQLTDVLTSLGYSRHEIGNALEDLREKDLDQSIPFDELIRRSLAFLSKSKK